MAEEELGIKKEKPKPITRDDLIRLERLLPSDRVEDEEKEAAMVW